MAQIFKKLIGATIITTFALSASHAWGLSSKQQQQTIEGVTGGAIATTIATAAWALKTPKPTTVADVPSVSYNSPDVDAIPKNTGFDDDPFADPGNSSATSLADSINAAEQAQTNISNIKPTTGSQTAVEINAGSAETSTAVNAAEDAANDAAGGAPDTVTSVMNLGTDVGDDTIEGDLLGDAVGDAV